MRLVSFRPFRCFATGPGRPPRRRAAALPALLLAALLGGSDVASAADPAPPTAAAKIADATLDGLFAALAAAPDDASAARARTRIEAIWQTSGSATADLLTARAAAAAQAGDRGLALDLVDAAIVVAPDWAGGRHSRALLHLAGHEIARASDDVAATLRLEPRHFGAMAMRAAIFDMGGRKAEALVWLRRIAVLDPRSPGLAGHIERLTVEVEGREL